jgi:hypothetical protein
VLVVLVALVALVVLVVVVVVVVLVVLVVLPVTGEQTGTKLRAHHGRQTSGPWPSHCCWENNAPETCSGGAEAGPRSCPGTRSHIDAGQRVDLGTVSGFWLGPAPSVRAGCGYSRGPRYLKV